MMKTVHRPIAGLCLALAMACARPHSPAPEPAAPVSLIPPRVPGAPAGVTAFVDVGVIPMDYDRAFEHQTVLVEGGRVSGLGPAAEIAVPAGARRIDGRGKFLLPGLGDCHAHMIGYGTFFALLRSSADTVMLQNRLFLWGASGMTTIRNMDHTSRFPLGGDTALLRLRARAAMGELWGPRFYTAGVLSGVGGGPLLPADVVPALTAYKAAGFDFVKIHGLFGHGQVFDSLVATAHRLGLPLEGHVNGVTTLERALREYRSIEHLTGYEEAMLQRDSTGEVHRDSLRIPLTDLDLARIGELAEATQRSGVWNCATQYNETLNAQTMGAREHGPEYLAFHKAMLKALQDVGARLLLGTDRSTAPRDPDVNRLVAQGKKINADQLFDFVYGDANAVHRELEAMVAAGLTPYQALATGTRNMAAFFGTLDESGTITLGKRADLLLLDGNPLEDVRRTERPAGVMIGGRWLGRAEIDRRTADIKASLFARCSSMTVFNQKLSC